MPITVPTTNFPWATGGNYPAGASPWSGQPTKVDASADLFTPGRSLPATNLNKILNDRDTTLQALVTAANARNIYILGDGNLQPVSGGHSWSNSSGSYLAAEQLGLVDATTGLTPFSAGVVAGDILEIDFAACFNVYSNEAGNYYFWPIKLAYSETATGFVSGSWTSIEANGNLSLRTVAGVAASATPDSVCVSWSVRLVPLATSGHVRFALAADRGAADENLTAGNCGGRWRWLRSG